MAISDIQGYDKILDLIPDGSLNRFPHLWSLKYSQVITPDGNTTDAICIVVANDLTNPTTDMIEVACLSPDVKIFPGIIRNQVFTLLINYHDTKVTHGWERSYFEVKDAEEELYIRCSDIKLKRIILSEEFRNFREW